MLKLTCAISSTASVDKYLKIVLTSNQPIESYKFFLFFSKFRRMVMAPFEFYQYKWWNEAWKLNVYIKDFWASNLSRESISYRYSNEI